MPASSPPPPMGTTSTSRSGASASSSRAHGALAGDDERVVVGRHPHEAVASAAAPRPAPPPRRGRRRAAPPWRPSVSVPCDLHVGREAGASRWWPGCRAGWRGRRRPGRGCRPTRPPRPRRRSSGVSCSRRFSAPRSLNDDVNCRFSNFSHSSAPVMAESVFECSVGVRTTWPSMAAAARYDVVDRDRAARSEGRP